jgi:hypothetical protein
MGAAYARQERSRLLDPTCLRETRGMQSLSALELRPQAQVLSRTLHSFFEASGSVMRDSKAAQEACHFRVHWAQPHRHLPMLDGLF